VAKTFDQPRAHRISRNRNNNRDRTRCLFCGLSGRRVHCDNDIHIESDKLGGEWTQTVHLTTCISILNADVLSFDPSEIVEPLSECIYLT
jgi:hypothetical protein